MPSTPPRMIARHRRHVELVLPNKPSVRSYSIGAANTLDAAFAGVTAMFSVPKGGDFRSMTLRRRGLGYTGANYKNLTRMVYDPEDFFPTSPTTLPHDAHQGYVRVTETNLAGTVLPASPILVIPPPGIFSSPRPSLTLAGTAPELTASATLLPPPGVMRVILPRFSDNISIRNRDATNSLFVSFGEGSPEIEVDANTTESFWDNVMSEIFLRGDSGAVPFNILAAIVNGEMA